MNSKGTDQTLDQLKSIARSLETLTSLRLFETFYSPEERASLVAQHKQLYADDAAAHTSLLRKSNEETVEAALEKRRETMNAIDRFETEHPLIKYLSGYAPAVPKQPREQ